jgi:PAS domain S-box-containing protein/putative nucleotidyltransferase with HDIG domain
MKNEEKSREQLTQELAEVHQRINELEKSEIQQRYKIIVDTADEGIWVFDEGYLTTFVNNRMVDMLGYTHSEIIGKSLGFFLFREDLPDFERKASLRRQGVPERYERRIRRKDGSILWAHVSATPIMGSEGRFQGSFAMFTDITERKEGEKALRESEEKYRSIFENAVEGMFQSTPDGQLITANPSMARIFRYASPEEMIAQVSNIGLQLYANEENRRAFQQLLKEHGIAGGFEAPFFRKDGSVLWGTLNVRAVKDSGGNVLYYEGTLEDITPRKKAEEELKKSEEKYRTIFENAVMGIYQVTPGGQYLSANPVLARIHGYSSPEEMISSIADITQLYVDPSRRAELKRVMDEQGFVKGFEIIMRKKDGSLHWVSNTAQAVRDERGAIIYYEGTIEDITSRKLAEESVKELKQTLLGTLHALSLSIEIREPGITGHHKGVSALGNAIARAMGLNEDTSDIIRMAGLVHDIGNMSVPGEILSKPGKLSELEYSLIKLHPRSGYDILKETGLPYPVAEIVLQHHERMNGSGYPQGLKGRVMLLEARILAVADVVEAMASPRPYRPARGIDAALEEMRKNKGTLYDAQAVDACLMLFKTKKFQL